MSGGRNPNGDYEVPQAPTDGISSIAWSPKANYFCASSWDNQVRCWELQGANAVGKASLNLGAPVLCSTWSDVRMLAWSSHTQDGQSIFAGGCDNNAYVWRLANNQKIQIAKHDAPIKELAWLQPINCLATGSWDKTLRYWDGRTPNAAQAVQLPERVYAMDAKFPLVVVGLAERHVIIYDVRKPSVPFRYQTRTIACFPDQSGFALGSIEGRVAIHHVDTANSSKNFAFKCHRNAQKGEIYAVNSIHFHKHGTFVTGGSDGGFNFWDKDSKQRLKAFKLCDQSISCCRFNATGDVLAYAVSYDWSKGSEYYANTQPRSYMCLQKVDDTHIRPRNRSGGNRW